jgi:hypothetical protein
MRGQLSHGATGQRSSTVIHILSYLLGETMTQLQCTYHLNIELRRETEHTIHRKKLNE